MVKKSGKRIGYVDWDLNNFHSKVYLQHLRGALKKRGFTVAGAWAVKEKPSRAWAGENNVPYFDTPKELNENVDYYMVLAPGTPEVHLDLCRKVFPFGKTTYVDKTFAESLSSAKKIFALADRHKTRIQTTSALRYTNVQETVAKELGGRKAVKHMVTWGGGRSFGEYAIHPVELAVSILGPNAKRLMRRGTEKQSQLLIDFTNSRTAVVNVFVGSASFAASVTTKDETRLLPVEGCDIFLNMAGAILDLFETGKPSIDRKESLAIRRILDAAADPRARDGFIDI